MNTSNRQINTDKKTVNKFKMTLNKDLEFNGKKYKKGDEITVDRTQAKSIVKETKDLHNMRIA